MTENTTTPAAPEAFDFDDWFSDAKLPERSADVFTRGDLVGRLEALQRRLQEETRAGDAAAEASLGDEPAPDLSDLEEEYAATLQEFLASKVTLFMRATPREEQVAIRDSIGTPLPKTASDDTKRARMEAIGAATLAASVVGVAKADGPRVAAAFTAENILALQARIGEAQMEKVNAAWRSACTELPAVSADFLPKSSGPASTQG